MNNERHVKMGDFVNNISPRISPNQLKKKFKKLYSRVPEVRIPAAEVIIANQVLDQNVNELSEPKSAGVVMRRMEAVDFWPEVTRDKTLRVNVEESAEDEEVFHGFSSNDVEMRQADVGNISHVVHEAEASIEGGNNNGDAIIINTEHPNEALEVTIHVAQGDKDASVVVEDNIEQVDTEEIVVSGSSQVSDDEHLILTDRVQPAYPSQDCLQSEGLGWQSIDRIDPVSSFLCRFPLLQEVSEQHKGAWTQAHVQVLRKWKSAQNEEETNRALRWLGFLPQALQRKPTRGGKVGRAQVAHRYNCVTEGDWATLVDNWEKDLSRLSKSQKRTKPDDDDYQSDRKRREVLGLITTGQVSKATDRVVSHGVADVQDSSVLDQLKAKFPIRRNSLPISVPKVSPIDSFTGLRQSLLALEPGKSPGSGGMRPEYLVALSERMEEEELRLLEEFGLAYTAGQLPGWFYRLWLSTQTVPVYKTPLQTDVRPLGVRNQLVRSFHKEVVIQSKPEIREFLEPEQLGLSQGGAAKLIHSIRSLLEQRPDFVCVKTDLKNFYNEINRRAILDVVISTPTLSHLVTFAAVILAPEVALEVGGNVWGVSTTGMVQGDPASGAFTAIGLQPSLVRLNEECMKGEGMARAGADDVLAVGPPSVVFPAIRRFAEDLRERCDCELQWTKSEVFSEDGLMPANVPLGLALGGVQVDGQFFPGIMVHGVPVGSSEYVTFKLREQAAVIIHDAEKTKDLLSSDRQALWTVLRLSVAQRFGYLQQLTPPSLCEPVAAELDTALWRILEVATGFKIPKGNAPGGLLIKVPIPSLDQRSFQEWAVRLPARLYGWGLRSLEDTCAPAYIGTLETAIPFMAGRGNVCPQLAESFGGEECWGEAVPTEDRWRVVLASGCTVGQELKRSWGRIRIEAFRSAEYIAEDVPEVLSSLVQGLGNGSVSGETRKKVVEARENVRAKVLQKALSEVRPRSVRPAWAWRQRDKISVAWLLAIPGYDTTLSSAEFAEAAASNLCLPSPACRGRVGEPIKGNLRIDEYGDSVQSASIPGDHWRKRHDALLHHLHRECLWAGLPVELEVYNLFSGLIQQEGLSRFEQVRQRQAIVPDMRITMPIAAGHPHGGTLHDAHQGVRGANIGGPGGVALAGQSSQVLHEIKIISSNQTRYRPGQKERGVDFRAGHLQKEYINKARGADRLQGVPEGVVGRVEEKLISLGEVRGIVAGQFGEVSEDMHQLVAALATSRVRVMGPTRSKRGLIRGEEGERSIAVGQIRRRLGVMTVRAQASSLLGRLEVIGPGSAAAYGRRQQSLQLERRWRREAQAHALAMKQGYRVLRTGFAMMD